MYAYVDETGNTGENIFDEAQPEFITAAFMSRSNFDLLYRVRMKQLSDEVGLPLHGNEIGLGNIEIIASDLLKILKQANAFFFLSRGEKKYLATAKLVDTIFDAGENLATPWHVYNFRMLRLLLVFKSAYLIDEPLIRSFWVCMMEKRETEAKKEFIDTCQELLSRVDLLPDKRSREIFSEALQWAIDNPEAIYLHVNSKLARYGHLPNMVAFTNLLSGIEERSKIWERPVKRIYHDRQMQFEKSLKYWHELISNSAPDPLYLPGGERFVFQRVFGSEFFMSNASNSPGIQVIDIILWLFKRISTGQNIHGDSCKLMDFVFRRSWQHDFSFEGVSYQLKNILDWIERVPISEEQMKKGKELLELSELNRQEKMVEYAKNKLAAASSNIIENSEE